MRIGIACQFRDHPDMDGPTLIQASTVAEREDMDEYLAHCSPERPAVFPRIGFMAYTTGSGRTMWSFVKYEAPQIWKKPYRFQSRGASLSTCRVGSLSCDRCGWHGEYPLQRDERPVCPWCGRRGASVSPVRENSDRFGEMLGELRGPLEAAAAEALASPSPEPFRFPTVVLGGPDVAPSPDVPPDVQGRAQENGVGLRPLSDLRALDELDVGAESHFLGILKGVFSGTMDSEEAKAGRSWKEGVVQNWVRLVVPDCPKGPVRFGRCLF